MKFHYFKLFISSLVVALMVFVMAGYFSMHADINITPDTLLQTKLEYVKEKAIEIDKLVQSLQGSAADLATAKSATQIIVSNIGATVADAHVLVREMSRPTPPPSFSWEKFGPTLSAIIASLGTLSSIILSWRKDVRDARADAAKAT